MAESLIFIVLGVLVIVFLMQLHFNAIAGRIAPLSRLEAKVDLLLKNANQIRPAANVASDVTEAPRRQDRSDQALPGTDRRRAQGSQGFCRASAESDWCNVIVVHPKLVSRVKRPARLGV